MKMKIKTETSQTAERLQARLSAFSGNFKATVNELGQEKIHLRYYIY